MAGNSPLVVSSLLCCIFLVSELSTSSTAASNIGDGPNGVSGEKLGGGSVVVAGNSTISSANGTFKLGFFTADGGANWYLGIWYASIPIPTYVWVANRGSPVRDGLGSSAAASLTVDGRLSVTDSGGASVWSSRNGRATTVALLETGNLVLLDAKGRRVWESFHFPADTWLPEMRITRTQMITCWRSPSDPSPGNYSLRLKPLGFGEFELVFSGAVPYWSTGNWTGDSFVAVPEMTVPYIYSFRFKNPFTPSAYFTYSTSAAEAGGRILTRFAVDPTGVLRQFVWSSQTEHWDMFWARPESVCRVHNLCGAFGFCSPTRGVSPCDCPPGFAPVDGAAWRSGDYSAGCRRQGDNGCSTRDGLRESGAVAFTGASSASFSGTTRSFCEETCLKNCSCVGLSHSQKTSACRNFYGRIFNLRNLTSDSAGDPESQILYLRVDSGYRKSRHQKEVLLIVSASSVAFILAVVAFAVLRRMMRKGEKERRNGAGDGEGDPFAAVQLRVMSYKDLHAATRGFSEKLGHGGFGSVFLGQLPCGRVAVKRLERPGGAGEREFRAEVCTIGSVQHLNLVRLRGFCCERAHRLLVYDYMPNGPLSSYLGPSGRSLGWGARFRIAVGTARGIAYLHEECRNCIIHCDIKPENILLDSDYGPKVSDFGLAKLVGRDFSRVVATMRGTWGYVAPEWISGVAITAKADVYSYGMTLLELIGGRRNVEGGPDGGGSAGDKWFFPPWAAKEIIEGRVEAMVDHRLGGEYSRAEAERAGLVAIWCIQDEEIARPTMGTVVNMLEGTVEVPVPPAPHLLQALVAGDSFVGTKTPQGSLSSYAGSVGSRQHRSDDASD